jgi:hypothetical protein
LIPFFVWGWGGSDLFWNQSIFGDGIIRDGRTLSPEKTDGTSSKVGVYLEVKNKAEK